jgi:hypothetical protein
MIQLLIYISIFGNHIINRQNQNLIINIHKKKPNGGSPKGKARKGGEGRKRRGSVPRREEEAVGEVCGGDKGSIKARYKAMVRDI